MLPTLRKFLDDPSQRGSSYVRARGFSHLYVRKGMRYINGLYRGQVICLANFEVNHPGRGVFGRFIARLRKNYPQWHLHVENVLNPRLPRRLVELGFEPITGTVPPCFWLPARSE